MIHLRELFYPYRKTVFHSLQKSSLPEVPTALGRLCKYVFLVQTDNGKHLKTSDFEK